MAGTRGTRKGGLLCITALTLALQGHMCFSPNTLGRAAPSPSRSVAEDARMALRAQGAAVAASAVALAPVAASADTGLPPNVLGAGLLSVVAVIVLLSGGIAIGRNFANIVDDL